MQLANAFCRYLEMSDELTNIRSRASLDRIDSDGHYEKGNLQLVCRFINFWKQAADDQEFRPLINFVRGFDQMVRRSARIRLATYHTPKTEGHTCYLHCTGAGFLI